jgi:hypothetical protein
MNSSVFIVRECAKASVHHFLIATFNLFEYD